MKTSLESHLVKAVVFTAGATGFLVASLHYLGKSDYTSSIVMGAVALIDAGVGYVNYRCVKDAIRSRKLRED